MTNIKPATPLPWNQPMRYSPEDGSYMPCGAIEGADGESVAVGTYLREPTICTANTAYIVAACNAYPRLVAALRKIDVLTRSLPARELGGAVGQAIGNSAALLRELGEDA